jgi:hypothetical protein
MASLAASAIDTGCFHLKPWSRFVTLDNKLRWFHQSFTPAIETAKRNRSTKRIALHGRALFQSRNLLENHLDNVIMGKRSASVSNGDRNGHNAVIRCGTRPSGFRTAA